MCACVCVHVCCASAGECVYNGSHTLSCDNYPHVDPVIKEDYVPVFNCGACASRYTYMVYIDIVTLSLSISIERTIFPLIVHQHQSFMLYLSG